MIIIKSSKKKQFISLLFRNVGSSRELFDKEHALLTHLNHSNLVEFFGYTAEKNYALIEHSDLNDLYTYLSMSKDTS